MNNLPFKYDNADLLYEYDNGDFHIALYADGTKIRTWSKPGPIPAFPESMDLKITNRCDKNCPYCHEDSTSNGKNGNFDAAFLKTLPAGMEIALGGGNVFEMIDHGLENFLRHLKSRHIFPSLTVNQSHLASDKLYGDKTASDHLATWLNNDLIYGIGISYNGDANELETIVNELQAKTDKNVKDHIVLHLIYGVHSYQDVEPLLNKGYKALLLGYKTLRRGTDYQAKEAESIKQNKDEIYRKIHQLIKGFNVLSFDNLAIKQLDLKRIFLKDEWNEFYMGDDGDHTMYIDLVENIFATSSTHSNRQPIENTIESMFQKIQKGKFHEQKYQTARL